MSRRSDKSTKADLPGYDDPGRGRRLGLDIGTVRIGVSLSDPDGMLATPVETIQASQESYTDPSRVPDDLLRILELIEQNFVVEVVAGLPVALKGNNTASTQKALGYVDALRSIFAQRHMDIPVRLVDERMSTMAATQALQSSGVNTKKGRRVIDQAAAVHILQIWLDQRKNILG